MPEDVNSPHPVGELVKNLKVPPLAEAADGIIQSNETRGVVRIPWAEMQKKVGSYVAEVKKENPDIPESEVEMVADLLFGPFRLDQKAIGGGKSEEERRISASIQHNIVHAVLDTQRSEASDDYVRSVYSTVSFLDRLSRSEVGKDSGLYTFYSGIRAELGIVKSLLKAGYKVSLPDYTQDIYEVPDEKNEVLQWDVKSGIDLVAESKGELLLIDAKGEFRQFSQSLRAPTDSGRVRMSASVYIHPNLGNLPEEIQAEIKNYAKVKRLTIFAPTFEGSWPKLEPTNYVGKMRKALASYSMPFHAEDAIIKQTGRII